ncbi:hypothetical protein ACQ4PT_012551 [Festuca glaucescens]
MPTARHRWCKWHVLRKAKESLGPVYSKNTAFKRDLHNLLDVIISVEEFETRWAEIVAEHDLVDNEFLSRAYENREMWAKPYFANTFCAGMTSTQRSESANHVLKTYIPRSAPMHLFVTQYDRLVTDRIADEGREEHATKQVNFILRTGAPIEKHATSLYTRSLFERFYRELFRSAAFSCRVGADGKNFVVVYARSSEHTDAGKREFDVVCDAEKSQYSCVCKFFEHAGIPCRHVLKVLVHSNVVELPPALVLKRWTVSAREGIECDIPGDGRAAARQADAASMHALLHASVMELVGMGITSRRAFEVAVDYVSHAKAAISAIVVADPAAKPFTAQTVLVGCADILEFDSSAAAPPRVRSRGRPKELRFKSPVESPGGRKQTTPSSAATAQPEAERPRKSSRFLKVYVVEHCGACQSTQHRTSACPLNIVPGPTGATPRRCQKCHVVGHNRSTCGRKSSYVTK